MSSKPQKLIELQHQSNERLRKISSLDWQNSEKPKHPFPNLETLRFLNHP
jgi:hypothetical protein